MPLAGFGRFTGGTGHAVGSCEISRTANSLEKSNRCKRPLQWTPPEVFPRSPRRSCCKSYTPSLVPSKQYAEDCSLSPSGFIASTDPAVHQTCIIREKTLLPFGSTHGRETRSEERRVGKEC